MCVHGPQFNIVFGLFSDNACSLMMCMVIFFEIIITKKCVNFWLKFIQMAVNLKSYNKNNVIVAVKYAYIWMALI